MSIGHVIDFTPDGMAQAMHNDKFDLSHLGRQSITRATEIKFDEGTQTWGLFLPDEEGEWTLVPGGKGFGSYETARKVEVDWLNACRIEGVAPDSPRGLSALRFLRRVLTP